MRRPDRWPGVAVIGGTLVLAVVVVLLLGSAVSRGRSALEASLTGEVQAVARSQDQRISATLSGTAGLAQKPFDLEVGSSNDLAQLQEILELLPTLRSGFFLVDPEGTLTQGVQLVDDDSIGSTYDRPGFDDLVGRTTFAQGVGGLLPVGPGLTTASPTIALVFPVLDQTTGAVRGSFVFESEVAFDSDFNSEIRQLGRGRTGQYLFFDDQGSVIAANDSALIATMIEDETIRTGAPGLHEVGGEVVVLADVPSAGWRIAFRQDRDEFESGLSGPIQTAGTVLVVLLVAVGGAAGVLLVRRLRAAREEQERLRRLAEAQEEFVSIVSHELRTPVAGVLGFLQTTIDHWDGMGDQERRGTVRRAATNARRLQSLTRDVLDSESLQAGRMTFSMGRVDLADEARAAVETARSLHEDRRIELDVVDGEVPITADADRIQQVLTNLVDNALQNAPPTEPVQVAVRLAGDQAELVVADRGPGLTDEVAARVFDRFVRGRADRIGGTGLGLYIAKSIVDAHGGTIRVESTSDGATFTVCLPLATARSGGPASSGVPAS